MQKERGKSNQGKSSYSRVKLRTHDGFEGLIAGTPDFFDAKLPVADLATPFS